MSHRNARLTPAGRKIMINRIASGRPVAHVAAEMGVSRTTAHRWWRRWQLEGDAGLVDRSSRPHRSPTKTPAKIEQRICRLRQSHKRGPLWISWMTGVPSSTVWAVLVRHGLNRLVWLDRPTGVVIRRYERDCPGDLLHLDIKKIGKIPPGGGWRIRGRGYTDEGAKRRRVGYTYLHVAIDDHSRLAYVEPHDNERAVTLVEFWQRAHQFYQTHNMTINEVLTDNGANFRSNAFADALAEQAIKHRRPRPRRPQTNGKAERFNRTMTDEFLYARVFRSEPERRQRLEHWIHPYNHHRYHTAITGPPITRVNNLPSSHS